MKFPELETPRLALTALHIEDTDDLFTLFSNQSVIKYYDLESLVDLYQAENLIKFFQSRFTENSGIRWAIRSKETQQLIGTCGFNTWSVQMKSSTIGYDLMPQYWKKGIATEAVTEIVNSAFSGKLPIGEINRIQADTIPGNIASEGLLLKIGFKEEGIRRQSGYWKNQFHDLKCFALLKSEYNDST